MSNWYLDMPDTLTPDGETALEAIEDEVHLDSRAATFIIESELTTEEFLPEAIRLTTEMSDLFPSATFALGDKPRVEWRSRDSRNETIELLYSIVAVDLVPAEPMLERLLLERMDND